MTLSALAIAIVVASALAIWWLRIRARTSRVSQSLRTIVGDDLVGELRSAVRAIESDRNNVWTPADAADNHPALAEVESALVQRNWSQALNVAEHALASTPSDPRAGLLLAWAAVSAGHANAAGAQMYKLMQLAPARWQALGPLAPYVAARAQHLVFEQRAGATELLPPLITTGDLAVISLASASGASTWLVGTSELQLDASESRAAIDEHRRETAQCLHRVLQALDADTGQPAFVDAAFIAGRLAMKLGLVADGKRMLKALSDRMQKRPDAEHFARDLLVMEDPSAAFSAALTPPAPPPPAEPDIGRGKRSKSLRVL
jgi:hypothetical protein